MAKVSKPVDKLVPATERTQVFTNLDASSGDILDIIASLHRPAKKITIETAASSDLTVRTNVVSVIYPLREHGENSSFLQSGPLTGANVNLAQGVEKIDGSMAQIDANPSLELTGPIKDLEVTWTTGTWVVTVY